MFVNSLENVCYNLKHHTTRTSDYIAGESDFRRFLRNEAPNQPESNFGWSKKRFENSDEASFLARRICSEHFTSTLCI